MENHFLLDIRSSAEFRESNIAGSTNIPMDEIRANLEKLRQIKQTILIICRSGARAHVVQDFLAQNKITNTKVLEGGFMKYGTKSQ